MTGRERIMAVLEGREPDRVPVSPFMQEEFLSYYFKDSNVSRVEHAVLVARDFGFDVMTRGLEYTIPYFLRNSYSDWEVTKTETIEDGIMNRSILITTPEGVLSQIEQAPYDEKTINGIHFSTSKYFFEDKEAWELFKKYVPVMDQDSINEMKTRAKADREMIGDTGIACPWGWGGVYNMASTYRSVESLMMDPYMDLDFYTDYMGTLAKMMAENYGYLADTEYMCMGMQGNIANAAMLSPDFYREHVLPYEKQIVDRIHDAGKYVLYHNCGHAKAFYDVYAELGVDIWETVAPTPQGDNKLVEAKEAVGDKLILMGNLDQVDFLKTASIDQIEKATRDIMETGKKNGNYIFACSDFLEKETPLENIKAMIDVAIAAG